MLKKIGKNSDKFKTKRDIKEKNIGWKKIWKSPQAILLCQQKWTKYEITVEEKQGERLTSVLAFLHIPWDKLKINVLSKLGNLLK
jgi:hypothetical protein